MQEHQPRAPRFDLHLPVRFISTDGLATGYCVNVSETGMLVVFDWPIDIWLEGELSVFIEGQFVGSDIPDSRWHAIIAQVALIAVGFLR